MADTTPPSGSGLEGYFATPQPPPSVAPQWAPPPAPAPPAWSSPYPVALAAQSNKKTFYIVGGAAVAVLLMVVAAVGVYLHNRHKLSLPATLNGQPMFTDEGSDILRRGLVDELDAAGAHSAVVGFYGVPGQPYAMVVAAREPAHTGDADTEISAMESGMTQNTVVSGMTDVSTGTFSGRMQCGQMTLQTRTVPVCIWADDTVGAEILYATPPAAAPTTALGIRQAIEH